MKLLPGKFLTLATTLALAITLAAHADEQKTELGEKMKIISKSVKQLKNQIADPAQQQSSITLAQAAETAAKDAQKLVPAKAASVPAPDRPKFVTDYQAQMDVLIKDFDAITSDLTAGKYDDAQKVFADLGNVKRDGHKKFTNPE
jgi:soluble cytochrome b562